MGVALVGFVGFPCFLGFLEGFREGLRFLGILRHPTPFVGFACFLGMLLSYILTRIALALFRLSQDVKLLVFHGPTAATLW